MSININSEAFCRKAYLNFHCYGNTMNISSEDMGKITQAWEGKIQSWQATVASDENEYEFDDSEYTNYKSEGKEIAQKTTGHDGTTDSKLRVGGDLLSGVAGSLGATIGKKVANKAANTVVNAVAGKTVDKVVEDAAKKVTEKAGEEAGKKVTDAGKNVGWIITAPLALATAITYLTNKPNKEEKEACDALQTEMQGAQATLGEAQGEMEAMSEEIVELSDEANTINEETNEEIKDQKTEYDMYMQTFLTIQEKVQNGEDLTDSEKALYKSVMGYMTEISTKIQENSEKTTLEVADLYDEIGTYQEGYDVAAETMGEIQGLTDFAEGFDEATRTLCYVEAAAQSLNAFSGGKAAYQAGRFAAAGGIFTAWAWAFAAMGATGAATSGIGTMEQFQWAGEVGTEIDMRKATQDLNTETMDFYDEEIDAYDGFIQGVEDLELEVPDEITPPENAELPSIGNTGAEENVAIETLKPKKELTEKTKM